MVYAGPNGEATVKLDGSGSYDDDGLEYFWYNENNELIAEGVDPDVVFAAGAYVIELVVDDGTVSSELNSVVVTVIEAIEARAYVFPRVLNTTSRGRYVIARMQLPDGVSKDDIADDSLRLIIGDTIIETIRQRGIAAGNRHYVFGFFDRGEVIAEADGKSKPVLYFYAHNYKYFTEQKWNFKFDILVLRSISNPFTKTFVHKWLFSKLLLALIYWLEELCPHIAGRLGAYPLFIIHK